MIRWWLFRLKRALRQWLDVDSRADAAAQIRTLRNRVEFMDTKIESGKRDLTALWTKQNDEAEIVRRFQGDFALWRAAHELETTHIEAGHLPCGCFSISEHERSNGRNHLKSTMDRVERWLSWRSREKAFFKGETHEHR